MLIKENKISSLIGSILAVWFLFLNPHGCSEDLESGPRVEWGNEQMRGFNISSRASNNVLNTVIDRTGANLIRLSFGGSRLLVDKNPPYGFNEDVFQELDRVLDWAETRGVRVVIDPHTTPGTRNDWTIYPDDEFWQDDAWQEYLIKLWTRIANEQKHRGNVIAGYDLLNEPAIPNPENCGDKWNELVERLVRTIRETGNNHPIIVEPSGKRDGDDCTGRTGNYIDRTIGLLDLTLPDDDNLVVSPHFYSPHSFTHQGVEGNPSGISYPAEIGNTYWDANKIFETLQPIRDFQSRYPDIPIFLGEFSVSRAAGPDGDVYLRDLIRILEEEEWSWTYHDFRGFSGWDPEMPYTDPPYTIEAMPRDPDTARMELLKYYYQRNH